MTIPTVDRLDLRGKRVFCRVDYNVPMEDGEVTDTTRIEATLPTIRFLRERGARIILAAHFGRPKGRRTEKDSLAPVRRRVGEILGSEVRGADDCIGPEVEAAAADLEDGEILLLENLRFHPGEEKNDPAFARSLRALADVYVNDAFGASHRAHASIDALPRLFATGEKAGGYLLARELEFLQKVTGSADHPFVAVLGGAKIAGKIEPLEVLANKADMLLIGGGMANTFLAAEKVEMGSSLVDRDSIEVARRILDRGKAEIVLPLDLVTGRSLDDSEGEIANREDGVPEGRMALDIGPRTAEEFRKRLEGAKLVFWNGPMGVFEKEPFARGTRAVAGAIASLSGATTIVGGGESVEAVKASGFADRISHISTGGGASLEFIAGEALPGVEALVAQAG
ncbi:MAG TPA: phosphoglycerate kinase [Thermoanaerobaculia bacterium]|nr:phosphoglycerate kinase [Thermoanaerobaculia bacterium]